MWFLRRLLLTISAAALLSVGAYVAGDALAGPTTWSTSQPTSSQPTSSQPINDRPEIPASPDAAGPGPGAGSGAGTVPASSYRPARGRVPRIEPGPRLLGPGDQGREVRELQARLQQIDWFQADVTGQYGDLTTSAVRGFQAKRAIPVTGVVDQRTRDRLSAMTAEPTTAELHNRGNAPGALDARCRVGRVLCVDKATSTLRFVVDGEVRQTLDARFGGSSTPTREGSFEVYFKSANHVSRLYGSAMPYAMFFSGGQAVHYSSDFASVGYAGASHGCVNIRDHAGIARLFDQVRVGDRVVVYWS